MRAALRTLSVALVPLLAFLAARAAPGWHTAGERAPDDVAALAGAPGPATGTLRFAVRERGGGPIPARLTFERSDGRPNELFTAPAAAPRDFAARTDVVYSRTGSGAFTLPTGSYRVIASHGPEWSLATQTLEVRASETTELAAELVHELDTTGWIGADFHLHTLTYSGHGDASVEERLLSFLGEGLELAVATDHNHLTDYRPTMSSLGIEGAFTPVTGNEVSTPIGHFNAFPLDPTRAPVDSSLTNANQLFRLLRAETNASGVVPVIQLNHPRLDGLDCFARMGLDPVTGTSASPVWSRDFDSIEILNDNSALGYADPVTGGRPTHGHAHSALADWFHLLDQGERYAAVGNSDSHHVRSVVAGYPRNYVRSATDDAARIDVAAVAEAVRAKQLFTTTGPFVEVALAGTGMGGTARATDGHATLAVKVRAASWVDCDRAKVWVNDDLAATLPIAPARGVLRLEQELELCFLGTCARHGRNATAPGPADAWVVVVVEGDDPLVPVLDAEALPLAIANPIWVDADGDGTFTSPRERIAAALRGSATPDLAHRWFAGLRPAEQALALGAVQRGPFAGPLVTAGLASAERAVRLAAARAAERTGLGGPQQGIQERWSANRDDPFFGALLLRVLVRGHPVQGPAVLAAYVERFGDVALRRYAGEILPCFPEGSALAWQVLGPLDAKPTAPERPPASDASVDGRGGPTKWTPLALANASAFADLRGVGGGDTENSRVYAQTFLRVDAARTVLCAFGSDDGARVWLGERLVYEDRARKRANALEKLLALELQPGWNRLVLEIENGTGEFGFYCRLFESGVESANAPR